MTEGRQEHISREQLVALLSDAIGEDKARAVVRDAMRELGHVSAVISRDEGLAVLEHLANMEGIVAAVARFARARLLLR